MSAGHAVTTRTLRRQLPHLVIGGGPDRKRTLRLHELELSDPFAGPGFATWQKLASLTTQTLGTAHQFTYNASGEMTQVTTPLGGTLGWSYRTYTYSAAGDRVPRGGLADDVWRQRAMSNTWNMTTDAGATQHATWTVSDVGANSSKVWTFSTGLAGELRGARAGRDGADAHRLHVDHGLGEQHLRGHGGEHDESRGRARCNRRARRRWMRTGTSRNRRCTITAT